MVGVLGEDGRPGGRIALFAVDAEAGQVGPDQDASQGRGTPAAANGCWQAACVQFATQRGEGLTSESAPGHVLDDGCLVGFDGAEVRSVAVAPGATMGSASLGQLLLLAADPPGDVVGLLGMHGGQDAGAEQVIGVADIDLARDGGDVPGPGAVADLQELLQLLGLAHQPVLVVDDDRVDDTFLQVLEHLDIALAGLVGVLGGRQVVVAVLLDDWPAKAIGQRLAVLALPADPEATGFRVSGHAQVEARLDYWTTLSAWTSHTRWGWGGRLVRS